MSTPIFTPPQGLLSFLGTKTLGVNPAELIQQVQPNISLMPFWLAGYTPKTQRQTTGTIAVPGVYGGGFTVPSGKVWIPLFHTTLVQSVGAGDTGRARPAISDVQGAIICLPGGSDTNASTNPVTALNSGNADWWINPVVLQAGMVMTAYVQTVTVVVSGVTVVLCATYIELDV